MKTAIDAKDFKEIKQQAHLIKGNAGHCRATKLHYAAYYMHEAFQ